MKIKYSKFKKTKFENKAKNKKHEQNWKFRLRMHKTMLVFWTTNTKYKIQNTAIDLDDDVRGQPTSSK